MYISALALSLARNPKYKEAEARWSVNYGGSTRTLPATASSDLRSINGGGSFPLSKLMTPFANLMVEPLRRTETTSRLLKILVAGCSKRSRGEAREVR